MLFFVNVDDRFVEELHAHDDYDLVGFDGASVWLTCWCSLGLLRMMLLYPWLGFLD